MIPRQLLHTGPAVAASYLVGCGGRGQCAVVDPVGGIEPHLQAAGATGMRIRYVVDTHVHADHLSPGRELAAVAAAEYVPRLPGCRRERVRRAHAAGDPAASAAGGGDPGHQSRAGPGGGLSRCARVQRRR